jgi:hypothetical protein
MAMQSKKVSYFENMFVVPKENILISTCCLEVIVIL